MPFRENSRHQSEKLRYFFPTTCSLQGTEYLPRTNGIRSMPRLNVARGRCSQPCSQVSNSDAASGYQHRSNLFHFKVW